jgi:hypothetical protein
MENNNPKLEAFHESLVKSNYGVPDYATFEQTLKDPAKSKTFYDALVADKYEMPDYETFVSDLGLKKKDVSEYGLPSSKILGDIFSKVAGDIPKLESNTSKEANPEQIDNPETLQYPHWTDVSKALGIPLGKEVEDISEQTGINPRQMGEPETIGKPKEVKKVPSLKEIKEKKPEETTTPVDKTLAKLDVREPYLFTVDDYLKKRGVTPDVVGLKPDVNTDRLIDVDEKIDFDKKLEDAGLYKPTPQYRESYTGAAINGIYKGTANMIRDIGYILNEVPEQMKKEAAMTGVKVGAKLKGYDSETTQKYMEQVATAIDNGMYGNQSSIMKEGYEGAAKWLDSAVKTHTPNNEWGRALESTGAFIPDLIGMSMLPEVKAPLLAKYGLQGMLKFPAYLGTKTYIEEAKQGKKLKEIVPTSLEAAAQGMVYNGLGVWAKEIGEISKSIGAGMWTSKSAEILANSLGFGGITAAQGGSAKQGLLEGLAFSALGAPEAIKAGMQKKAMLNWMTATDNNIRMVASQKIDPFKLRKESNELYERSKKYEGEQKDKLLWQKNIVDNTIDIAFTTNQILKNPKAFIENINSDQTLSAREKKIWTNKINNTVNMVDPRILESQPISENIKSLENELGYWNEKTDIEPDVKAAKIEALENQIKEAKKARIDIFSTPLEKYEVKDKGTTSLNIGELKVPESVAKEKESETAPKVQTPEEIGKELGINPAGTQDYGEGKKWDAYDVTTPNGARTQMLVPEGSTKEVVAAKRDEMLSKWKPTEAPKETPEAKKARLNDRLADLRDEYNSIPKSYSKKRAAVMRQVQGLLPESGHQMKMEGTDLTIINSNGKNIRRVATKGEYQKLDDIPDVEQKKFTATLLKAKEHLYGLDIPVYGEALDKAVDDLLAGKTNQNTQRVVDALGDMYKTGAMKFRGEAQPEIEIPAKELTTQINDKKFNAFVEENGGFGLEQLDKAVESGLIDRSELQDYKKHFEDEYKDRLKSEQAWADEEAGAQAVDRGSSNKLPEGQETRGKDERTPKELVVEGVTYKNKQELFDHLDKVAINEQGEINTGWFDRETASWPGIDEVRAISEWTAKKKLEIKARKEQELKNEPISNEKPINNEPNSPISKGEENQLPRSPEAVQKPVIAKGEEKPVRTTDPVKQKQIEVIDKEYDNKITDKQKELDGIPDQIDRAIKKANERNGIFGDMTPIEKDEIIKREEQGFNVSLEAIRKPFEERQAQLTKEIDALNKERESKIGEVLKQQTLGFEEPIKAVKFYDALKKNNAPRIQVRDEYGNERVVFDPASRQEYMDKSDETGRNIRWGAELSDGRVVSLDGLIRITEPDVWARWESRIKGMKLENKNEFIIKQTLDKKDFDQLLKETVDFLETEDVYSQTYRGRDEKTGEKKYTTDINDSKINKLLKEEGHPLAGIFNRELTLKDGTKVNPYQTWLFDLDQGKRVTGGKELPKAEVKATTNTLNDAVSKYGWSAVKNPEGFWLQNKNGQPVVKVVQKKGVYQFFDMSGKKLMDGRGDIAKASEKLLKEYYYAKEVKAGTPSVIEAPIAEKKAEPTPQGIKFKDKTYTEIDQVLDALDKGEITFEESKQLREDVGKFEEGLRNNAENNVKDITNRIDRGANDIEDQIKKDIDDKNSELHMKLFPDLWSKAGTAQWKVLDPVRTALANTIAKQLKKGVTSQSDELRWSTKVLTNLYNGLLRTQKDMHGSGIPGQIGKLEMSGAREYGKYKARNLLDSWRAMVKGDWDSLVRVWSVLDPTLATKPTENPLTYGDLGLAEKNLYFALKEWMTWGHEITYANGLIPTKTYLKFKDVTGSSNYIARMYDKFEMDILSDPAIREFAERGNDSYTSKIAADIYKARKELNGVVEINGHEYDSIEALKEARDNGEITSEQYTESKDVVKSDEWRREHAIKDPTYIVAKRIMQTIQNVAIKQYMDAVITNHPEYVLTLPKNAEIPKGFRRMGSSYAWGPFRNKVVANHIVEDFTGFFYQNALVNTTYDAVKMLDRTKLNQFYKKYRTVYNPFVQTGNITGNVFFATINGINPFMFIKGMYDNRNISKRNPALYESLLKAGYIGPVAMTGELKPLDILNPEQGAFGKFDEFATKAYVGADNLAKISAYQIYRRQGLTHEQAIRRGYDAFQNYATVGKTWDIASKIPLFGPTFVKFQADLQRILVNNMLTTPLTTIGTVMMIKMLGNLSSALSGETEEEQMIREQRKGVPRIPFVDIPLSFKVGKREVNVARYLSPLYLYNRGDSEMELSELSKFMPIQFQQKEEGKMFPLPAFADATWGWLGSVIADKDFRGMSISDPKKTAFTDPNTPTEIKVWNVINYALRSQMPFYKGTRDVIAGATGQLDYYGRKRTWFDAIINNVIKIQQFDKPEIKNYVERNLNYLTSKYASLATKMGDAQSVFYKTIKEAEDKELSPEAQESIYKAAVKLRDKSIGKSLEEQIPVYQEIERLTEVYKKWYPNDQYLQDNYMNIESGKNQRFNVLDGIDLQKNYPEEYSLLKKNNLIKRPEIPKYWQGKALTDEEKKAYSNIYWSEYIRILDSRDLLNQEGMDEMGGRISRREKVDTPSGIKEVSRLQDMANDAALRARMLADREFRKTKQ